MSNDLIFHKNRLGANTLDFLPSEITRPTFDRASLQPGHMHLGAGAFHRCHQAEYTDDLLSAEFGPWGIVDVNLRPPDLGTSIGEQDNLYCRELRSNGKVERKIIGSIAEAFTVLDTAYDPQRLTLQKALHIAASADIKLISCTITEKGYCHIPTSGKLDEEHPDILNDIAFPKLPCSAPGFILRVLAVRRERGLDAPTLMSCDNVPGNGNTLRQCVLRLAELSQPKLVEWIARDVCFLNTMVDRIVPATRAEHIIQFEQDTGVFDAGLVVGEPFRMWAIEKDDRATIPNWEKVGAILVSNVEDYETLKMRVVNGIQSNLCHLGFLAGHEFMSDVMQDKVFAAFASRTVRNEVLANLPDVRGINVNGYVEETLERLRNVDLQHRTAQISTDGSRKIRQRLIEPIVDAHRAGQSVDGLMFGLAGWVIYATGRGVQGDVHTVDDPVAAQMEEFAKHCGNDLEALINCTLSLDEVFPDSFTGIAELRRQLFHKAQLIMQGSVTQALQSHLAV